MFTDRTASRSLPGTTPGAVPPTPATAGALLLALLVLGAPAVLLAHPSAAGAPPADGEEKHADHRVVVVSKVADEDGPGSGRTVLFHPLSGGYLGVELTRLTPELRTWLGVPDDRGVLVARVEEGSPAAEAGLAVGDVITEIDGEPVDSALELGIAVRKHSGGEVADLVIYRDGRPLDFAVTVRERERRQVDLGAVRWEGGLEGLGPLVRGGLAEGDLRVMPFDPQALEELRESLGELDLPALGRGLAVRNRELEQRLERLEERLKDLERELERERRR